jgi:hypothetical protein
VKFNFHPEAERELNEAIAFYEDKEIGLGFDFAAEVYSTILRLMTFPQAWPLIDAEIRRSLVMRFPYGVLYSEGKDEVIIIAVMNLHRKPDYWKDRV